MSLGLKNNELLSLPIRDNHNLIPLEMLVSSRIKNNGPKENESNIPRGIAGNISNIY